MSTGHRNHLDPQMTAPAGEAFSAPTESPPADLTKQYIYRLLTRIDRLEYLIDVDAPGIVVRNERRMVRSAARELIRFGASLPRDGESEPLDAAISYGALAKLLGSEAGRVAAQ